jgi:hypothetical protein
VTSNTVALTSAHVIVGNSSNKAASVALSGDATIANTGALTLASTIVAAGPIGDASHVAAVTYDAKGRLTTVTSVAIAIAAGAVSGLATVATSGSASDLGSGTVPAARLPAPTASTLGGVESLAAVTHNFLTSISTAGVPTQAQPAAADLSDYVTGTWTPTLHFVGGTVGITYNNQNGYYTQIGNTVFFQADMTLTSKGSSTGAAYISGLPLTSKNQTNGYVAVTAWVNGVIASFTDMLFYNGPNSSLIILDKLNTGAAAAMTDADFTNTTEIMFMGHYQV